MATFDVGFQSVKPADYSTRPVMSQPQAPKPQTLYGFGQYTSVLPQLKEGKQESHIPALMDRAYLEHQQAKGNFMFAEPAPKNDRVS